MLRGSRQDGRRRVEEDPGRPQETPNLAGTNLLELLTDAKNKRHAEIL